jgi:hypothetical protein
MKIAVLSESSADEAAALALVSGLLGGGVEAASFPSPRTRGWHATLGDARAVLIHLHYQTDADALVTIVDSDESTVHAREHEQQGQAANKCRLCHLRGTIRNVQTMLRPRQGRGPIKTAVGLAVPAIEAWYLVGQDNHVTEAAWIVGQKSGKFPYSKQQLKERAYGTDRPSLNLETERALAHVHRIVRGGKLPLLEKLFPSGFGALAEDVRRW